MKTNYVVVRIYNNDQADIETENNVLYTDRKTAMEYIAAARHNGYNETFKKFNNNDQTYWFN